MRAVLLRVGRQNPLVLNAQAQPPDVELGEAVNPGRGEGHPIVGANRAGQPVLAKQSVEDGAHALPLGGEQAVARQQIASVLIGNRQRIAVEAIARAEVARSEEHTSELQSHHDLVCRLLLEKKKKKNKQTTKISINNITSILLNRY